MLTPAEVSEAMEFYKIEALYCARHQGWGRREWIVDYKRMAPHGAIEYKASAATLVEAVSKLVETLRCYGIIEYVVEDAQCA